MDEHFGYSIILLLTYMIDITERNSETFKDYLPFIFFKEKIKERIFAEFSRNLFYYIYYILCSKTFNTDMDKYRSTE